MSSKRKKAIIKRRIFILACIIILAFTVGIITFIVKSVFFSDKASSENTSSKNVSSINSFESSSNNTSSESKPKTVIRGKYTLDAEYSNLLLVNDKNPLPKDFDYEGHLTTIPDNYINGSLKQINSKVWPYMKAMIEAAWADNVKLYVWSPYRSYSTQNMLYQNQVTKFLNKGQTQTDAEKNAATIVARPGTSEHHTGLAADFNMADDKFESTPMFTWLSQHAADYGFIMRYSGDKQNITGVIHESWHYRFVGINVAQEMNERGMCLEEYVEWQVVK